MQEKTHPATPSPLEARRKHPRHSGAPRAHAVLGETQVTLTPDHRLKNFAQMGDVVMLAGCRATFVVVQRRWTVASTSERLEILLDLADEPALTAVTAPR